MKITELVEIQTIARSLDLGSLRALRKQLDAAEGTPSLLTGPDLEQILAEYVSVGLPDHEPLHNLFAQLGADGSSGAGFLIQGPAGVGKTHLLYLTALLSEYQSLRQVFLQAHPQFQAVLQQLDRKPQPIVVPVPLREHRPEDEHLEDIVFDRVEQELRRSRYKLRVPLSEQSYALDLIDRHILPRYRAQLDEHVGERYGGYQTWGDLARRDKATAVIAARSFAQSIGYPLDFRQSRVERMARLSEVVQSSSTGGIMWLVDDLWQFLAAAGTKAVRSDIAFLEFLGQRTRLEHIQLLVTIRAGLEELSGVEPYILAGISDAFEHQWRLSPSRMRQVAHVRGIRVLDRAGLDEAVGRVYQAYRQAFGEPSFTQEQLAASYPLHPACEPLLETIYQKYFAEGDALVDFLQVLREGADIVSLERDCRRLVSLPDIFALLSSRLASHPRASAYVREVFDYYDKNAARISPEHDHIILQLAQSLILLSLANTPVSPAHTVELIGVDEQGAALVTEAQAAELLEQMRLRGNYVDVRGGADEDCFMVDIHTNLSELARNRLMTARSGLMEADPRIWRAARRAASGPEFPLAHFDEPTILEITWQNTPRFVSVETADLTSLTSQDLRDFVADLTGNDSEVQLRLLIAELLDPERQMQAFENITSAVSGQHFSGAVLAWLPRPLAETEMDKLLQLAACRQVLRDSTAAQEQPEVSDRIAEEAATLEPQVARIVARAYREGRIVSAAGKQELIQCDSQIVPTWVELLASVTDGPISAMFPEFVPIAPRRLLSGFRVVDRLVNELIRHGSMEVADDPELAAVAQDIIGPLKLVTVHDDSIQVDVSSSTAALELLARVRQRDRTPETERGKPVAYRDLQAHVGTSKLGLTPEMYELTLACLLKVGWLVAVDEAGNSVSFELLDGPVREAVHQVARAPLLSMGEWRTLTRISKMVLAATVPRPDHATQTAIFDRLIEVRQSSLKRIGGMKAALAQLQETLGHSPTQWQQAHASLEELSQFFHQIDPTLMPAESLKQLVSAAAEFVKTEGGPSRLAHLMREADAIWQFFEHTATLVVTMRDYLTSPELRLDDDADLRTRQQRLLALIGTGEQIIADSATFGRLAQIFMATYKRRYLNWHGRCNRPSLFEHYRMLRSSVELRTLAQLQRISLQVQDDAGRAFEVLQALLQRRCDYPDLGMALDTRPICPACGLYLDVEPDLVAPEEILGLAREGVDQYVQHFQSAEFRRMLGEYLAGLPSRGELAARLDRLLHLDEHPGCRQLLTLLSDEVIAHLNRMFSGKKLKVKDFAHLRELLAGRTVSRQEALELFQRWLHEDDDDEESELIHIEP
ncbi:MAG: hypothetical protein GX358_10185 [candidate division WS1 bacterium]|nr:hypothetical protein [candidate division WS1 bacterium]